MTAPDARRSDRLPRRVAVAVARGATSADRLCSPPGSNRCALAEPWARRPTRGFIVRGGALVAWRSRDAASTAAPFRIVGAHTDSPCLRIKPRPDTGPLGWRQLGVEVYGGVLLNSWLDRDLGIAGRVVLDDGAAADVAHRRRRSCRVPQLAIHLDRDVNERGLVLDKQEHLTPIWGTRRRRRRASSRDWLAEQRRRRHGERSRAGSCACSTARRRRSSVPTARCSPAAGSTTRCRAGPRSTRSSTPRRAVESPGHRAVRPRGGRLGEHDRRRRTAARARCSNGSPSAGGGRSRRLPRRSSPRRSCVSADNAHAVHPNYPERHEPGPPPDRQPRPGDQAQQQPALRHQRRRPRRCSSGRATRPACRGRCSSVATTCRAARRSARSRRHRLGIDTVDVGVPQLSMHSARELCGVDATRCALASGAARLLRRVGLSRSPGSGRGRTGAAARRGAALSAASPRRGGAAACRRAPAPVDRLADDDMQLAGEMNFAPLGIARSRAADADRDDRAPRLRTRCRWRRRTAAARSGRTCARPRGTAPAARRLEHCDAALQRLAVGGAAGDREPAERREQPAEPAVLPLLVLAHEPQPAAGHAGRDRRVEDAAVHRREDEQPFGRHVLATLDRHPAPDADERRRRWSRTTGSTPRLEHALPGELRVDLVIGRLAPAAHAALRDQLLEHLDRCRDGSRWCRRRRAVGLAQRAVGPRRVVTRRAGDRRPRSRRRRRRPRRRDARRAPAATR